MRIVFKSSWAWVAAPAVGFGKAVYAPGTVRTWKGKKFIKGPDKKWRPYQGEAAGAETPAAGRGGGKAAAIADMKLLSGVLSTGKSGAVHSRALGEEVVIEAGRLNGERPGQKGEGLKHIIEERAVKDHLSEEETAALLVAVLDAVRNGTAKDNLPGRIEIEKGGIIAIVNKNLDGAKSGKWLLTGYKDRNNKKQATDTIKTATAQYGYAPEFSFIRTQVGAVVASLNRVSSTSPEKSSPQEQEGTFDPQNPSIRKAIMKKVRIVFHRKVILKKSIDDGAKLAYFKRLVLEHLEKRGEEAGELKKAGMPVGTIREWKGKKYVKVAPGRWRPKYDGESRGAKAALAALKRKVDAAKTAKELMDIVMENRDRFSGPDGNPLPFVQELHDYVAGRGDAIDAAGKKAKRKAASSHKTSKDGNVEGMDESLARKVKKGLDEYAEPMLRVEFTRAEYNRLFPEGKAKTPLGEVKLGENQFEKLGTRGREKLLGAMYQTLTDPVVVLPEKRDGEDSRLYIKSFRETGKGKDEYVMSVVVDIDGQAIAISTGDRRSKQVDAKIKAASIPLYLKGEGGGGPTQWNRDGGPVAHDLEPEGSAPHHPVSPQSGRKSSGKSGDDDEPSPPLSGIEALRDKYQSSRAVEGDEDDINVKGEEIRGRWKLVEADAPTASHDETTFHSVEGFPETEAGSNVNDRDYEHDRAAQEMVVKVGMNYDSRALALDTPVVVTTDGVVISGNNRTMSSKIAAKNGTDTKYVEALKRKAKKFGLTEEQIAAFKHPRVVFEVAAPGKYDTDLFAKFNDTETKKMSPIETAVKMSKRVKPETLVAVSKIVGDFETMGDLYKNDKATAEIYAILQKHKLLNEFDLPLYFADNHITRAGEEFLENTMIGSVVSEANIRKLNKPGVKSIRQKLVRAILPLVENRGMGGYSVTRELNAAVDAASDVTLHRDKFRDIREYLKQSSMFEDSVDDVTAVFAEKLEGKSVTQKDFAAFLMDINAGLRPGANGEADLVLGGVESKEEVLKRVLNLKKALAAALRFLRGAARGEERLVKVPVTIIRDGETVTEPRWTADGDVNVEKSLTWSGHKLQGRTRFQGMDISIENRKGSVRSGVDRDGHEWRTVMNFPYGYIRGTVGKDKDHVDCYIGPNQDSARVFVVHQQDPDTHEYDEDKVMLGFDSEEEARRAYLSQYDRPGFLGSIDEMGTRFAILKCNPRGAGLPE